MRKSLITALVLMAATPAYAAPATIDLFNGKDLVGWTYFFAKTGANADGHMTITDVFKVQEDGSLLATGEPYGYIRTNRTYKNFHLHLEWRFPPGDYPKRNGGVFFRVLPPDRIFPKSYEAEIKPGHSGDMAIPGSTGEGASYFDPAQLKTEPSLIRGARGVPDIIRLKHRDAEKPIGEWNTYDITVDGGHLLLKVNGVVVNEAHGAEEVAGNILLQSEGSPIQYRNVRLTPIVK